MSSTIESNSPAPTAGRHRWASAVAFGALLAALTTGTLAIATPAYAVGATPVGLGRAAAFAVLAGGSVGNTVTGPVTVVRGDLGVAASAGTIGGFPPGLVTGVKYAPAAPAVTGAMDDLGLAYADAEGRTPASPLAGDLIGLTLHPGVYGNIGAVANTGIVTLDSQGVADGVFIFQVGGAFSLAASAKVKLTGGTQAKNVFWQVNGAASLGAGAEFAGTLMTAAAIDVGAGTLFNGRALAKTGAIALNSNQFYSRPPVVTILGGSAAAVANDTPTVAGTTNVDRPATVTVTIGTQTFAATVQSDGTWSVTAQILANGTYAVTASATDAAGNNGTASQSLTIDTVPPVVTITGGAALLANTSTPTFRGTTDATPGSLVTVAVDGIVLTAVVQVNGSWNVTPAALADGAHNVVATVHDEALNVGSATQTLTIDTVAPLVTITGGAAVLTNHSPPTVAGTTDMTPGSTVTVTVDGIALTAVVQVNGSWSVTTAALADGAHNVVATARDQASNVGSATQTLTIDTVAPLVTITGGAIALSNHTTPTISGWTSAASGSTVTVTVDAQSFTILVQSDHTWNVTPAALADGAHAVTASVNDPAGNIGTATQTLTIDTVPPVVTITGGAAVLTNTSTPTVAGATDVAPGSTVAVTIGGHVLTTLVQSDHTWNVTPAALADGAHAVTASVNDPAGNTGTATQTLTIDTVPPPSPPSPSPSPIVSAAAFTPISPKRVFDTRAGESPNSLRYVAKTKIGGARELEVQLTDLAGYVPAAGVGAVSLNVTVTNPETDGFLTVYSCQGRESVSSVNYTAGRTVANEVIAPVSASGTVCFYAMTSTDLVVDINGWFGTGRAFTPFGPKRVFDTRPGESPQALQGVAKTAVPASGSIEVQMTGLAGLVPTHGVDSVSLNVTVTNPSASGFVTVYACGTRNIVSSVNYVAGQTVANAVIAPLSAAGTVCFYSLAATDLVVDINGWFTTGSGFTGVNPQRVLDTRRGESADALRTVPKIKIGGGSVLEVKVSDLAGAIPAVGVGAVSLNVTAVDPEGDGFVSVYPCGTREEVSSLNYTTSQTVANAVLTRVTSTGTICLFSLVPIDLIVDINGWFSAS